MSFAKLDSGIVNSTIWVQPHDVLRVWIWFLSQANARGVVRTAAPSLAHACMVPLDRLRDILEILESPDEDSRTPDHEGRRIEKIAGGWQILNYTQYRESRDPDARREQNREAQQRYRDKSVSQGKPEISQGKPDSAQAEAEEEVEEEKPEQKRQQRDGRRGARLPDGWEPSQAVREWAASEFPAVSLQTTLAEFGDYWRSLPGQRGCKLDWDATFRNRVREVAARQFRSTNRAPPATQPKSKTMQSINALEEMKNAALRQDSRRTLVPVGDPERPTAIAPLVP